LGNKTLQCIKCKIELKPETQPDNWILSIDWTTHTKSYYCPNEECLRYGLATLLALVSQVEEVNGSAKSKNVQGQLIPGTRSS